MQHDEPKSVADRRQQGLRVHINTGAVCNNNCIFCMEEDRDARRRMVSAITPADVRDMLISHRGAEEVCFTSGEPTTNPRLADYVRLARELGFARVSLMTNGRMLSHPPFTSRLLAAGVSRFYVSIHGHEAKLHDGLTRAPGSFAQTVRGIQVIRQLAASAGSPVELHTSTVVNRRNLPFLSPIYGFLRGLGVDQVVFNVMQADGRAHTHFDQLFPRYKEISAVFRDFLNAARADAGEAQVMAFLVDIPLCTTEGIDDFHRGFVEAHTHFGTEHDLQSLMIAEQPKKPAAEGSAFFQITRSDIDRSRRSFGSACDQCRHRSNCEGVWDNYVARFGWEEFVPVP